jgi:Spy/CpxP family protein refolding chaperone
MPLELVERVRTSLDLTDEQAGRVAEILQKRHEVLMKLHRETLKAELQAMRAEVATVLTPEQANKWNDNFESIMRIPPFPGGPGEPFPPHHGPPPQEGDRPLPVGPPQGL